MNQSDYSKQIYYILLFIAIIGVLTICKITSAVILPVVIAILLSFVLQPVIRLMNKAHIPWLLSTILIVVLFLTVISIIGTFLITSLRTILNEYPKYETKFLSIYKMIANTFNLSFDAGKSFFENIFTELGTQINVSGFIQKFALALSSGIISLSKNLFMIILLIVFLLAEMRIISEKIEFAFKGKTKGRVVNITKNVIIEVVRFVSIKFFISLATGILVYITAVIFRLDFAIVWAFIAFVMNFIPNFGSIFSVAITTIFALLQYYPSPAPIISIFIILLLINMALGNVVEPKIEGKNLGLSPFVILVSLTIWGWIWGFLGMILAVPLTVIIKIICENISFLHPIAILIGNQPKETQKDFSPIEEDEEF